MRNYLSHLQHFHISTIILLIFRHKPSSELQYRIKTRAGCLIKAGHSRTGAGRP